MLSLDLVARIVQESGCQPAAARSVCRYLRRVIPADSQMLIFDRTGRVRGEGLAYFDIPGITLPENSTITGRRRQVDWDALRARFNLANVPILFRLYMVAKHFRAIPDDVLVRLCDDDPMSEVWLAYLSVRDLDGDAVTDLSSHAGLARPEGFVVDRLLLDGVCSALNADWTEIRNIHNPLGVTASNVLYRNCTEYFGDNMVRNTLELVDCRGVRGLDLAKMILIRGNTTMSRCEISSRWDSPVTVVLYDVWKCVADLFRNYARRDAFIQLDVRQVRDKSCGTCTQCVADRRAPVGPPIMR
jgi:hypothetical protein